MDLKLEVIVVPVSDVDRAKAFYEKLGFRLDIDFVGNEDYRVIQFTPPGSTASIIFGIVIHNYRWRLGLAEGKPKYDELENRLAEFPVITVPTITLQGDADGAPRPDPSSYAKKFVSKYSHRPIQGGIGHNLPQEAPQAFAQAVVDVDRY